MCGLNGIFSFGGPPVDRRDIDAMRDRMVHRGPDRAGTWISPDARIGLGHRRLSIVDLSPAADQPMPNEDDSVQVVFNGEIYNHAELRADLERLGGHRWRTDHSDTEVIVHAYEQWGIDCIDRFRGMFAIALWDARAQRLWLVRDRLGVKPLYVARLPGRIAFASEIRALLALPGVPRRVNEESAFQYLSFLATPGPATMFAGIDKVPAASRIAIDGSGGMRTERYWDLWSRTSPLTDLSERDIADRLRDELAAAVRCRAISDVPVGVFLSGGIDSAVNASMFSACVGGAVQTFSIGYDAPYASYPDELGNARRTAERIGTDHHEQRLGVEDALAAIDAVVGHQDEPTGDVVSLPLYHVAKLARDAGVTVCQLGEGSDELFCGYPSWLRHMRVARMNALPVPWRAKQTALDLLARVGRERTYSYEVLRRAAHGEPTFWGGAEGLTATEKQYLLGADLQARLGGLSAASVIEPLHRQFLESSWEPTPLHWMTHLELNLRLPELLLMRVDRMTMASSVEGRVPFLDHKLVELALSIPTAAKTRGGELKRILKLAVRDMVPDDVIKRRKQGFGAPMREWMPRGLGAVIHDRVTHFADTTGLLDPARVREYLPKAEWSKAWLLFTLAAWHDRYIANAGG